MLQKYIWQKAYNLAVLETDGSKLQMHVWQAEIDLQERLNHPEKISHDEALAMEATILALNVLAQERLGSNLNLVSVS